jgi:hypothetical protein
MHANRFAHMLENEFARAQQPFPGFTANPLVANLPAWQAAMYQAAFEQAQLANTPPPDNDDWPIAESWN